MGNWIGQPYSLNSTLADGKLEIAGCEVKQLAENFQTPLFVMDKLDFLKRAESFKSALNEHLGDSAGQVYYAGKAFLSVEVTNWINEVGLGLDLCSGGEIALALKGNFPPSKIEFHGNNKSEAEIELAISNQIEVIVLDSFIEIERVARIAKKLNRVQKVYIRTTPGIEAHTHEYIMTAHEDVKFGFSIAGGDALRAIELVEAEKSLQLIGLHCHIGSQIFTADSYQLAISRLIPLFVKYRELYQKELTVFNLGGGFGIPYTPLDEELTADEALSKIGKWFKAAITENNLLNLKLSIEPGRAIAARSMTTIYTVGTTKDIKLDDGTIRRYIAVDGGFIDNLRPALYNAIYTARLANRDSAEKLINSRIVGKHCESGDVIVDAIDLPADIQPGDLIAVPVTGAYGYSMANNYNQLGRPAVVVVENSAAGIMFRRENPADFQGLEQKLDMRPLSHKE